MLRTPAYHRNRQAVRDRITNYTQVNELAVRNTHGATRTSQPKSLRIRLLNIEALVHHTLCSEGSPNDRQDALADRRR